MKYSFDNLPKHIQERIIEESISFDQTKSQCYPDPYIDDCWAVRLVTPKTKYCPEMTFDLIYSAGLIEEVEFESFPPRSNY